MQRTLARMTKATTSATANTRNTARQRVAPAPEAAGIPLLAFVFLCVCFLLFVSMATFPFGHYSKLGIFAKMSHAIHDRQRCNFGWCAVRTLQTVWAFHEKCVFLCFLGFCVFVCCVCFCSWFLRRKAPLFFFFVCLLPFLFLLSFSHFSRPPGSISQLTFPSSFSRFFCNTEQHSSHINKRPPSDPQASQPYASCRHHHHQCSQKATSPQILVAFQNLVL